MSALRDVRLLIVQHLDVSTGIKRAVADLINLLDLTLEQEGFQNTPELDKAVENVERAILDDNIPEYLLDAPSLSSDEDDLFVDDDEDDDELED